MTNYVYFKNNNNLTNYLYFYDKNCVNIKCIYSMHVIHTSNPKMNNESK